MSALATTEAALSHTGLPAELAAAGQAHASAPGGPPAATPALPVGPPFQSSRWQEALGQQVLWVARQDQQVASLIMNPPELGPVRVTIELNDGRASAAFVSLLPDVRQAIEDAVPRLKEMFAEAGLQLQHASVGSGDARRHAAGSAAGERSAAGAADGSHDAAGAALDNAAPPATRSGVAARLVDLFA